MYNTMPTKDIVIKLKYNKKPQKMVQKDCRGANVKVTKHNLIL